MKFRDFFYAMPKPARAEFAKQLGLSVGYLNLIASRHRDAGETIALAIERETGGQVTVAELRPQFAEDLKRSGYVRQPSCNPPEKESLA